LLSGALIDNLSTIFQTPVEFINLLAKDLLSRSGYFMQIIIVSSSLGMLMELYRVVPLFQSVLRANLGRRLTEKERNRKVGFLRPLSLPDKVYFSRLQARYPLYFLVLFVYSVVSPLVCWFCLAFFMFAGSVYRYQFVFNYPSIPDSGGTIWLYGMRVLLSCLVMAQLIILSVLFRADVTIIGYSMLPLFIITCIFVNNLHTNYFQIGTHLPAHMCLNQDLTNAGNKVNFTVFTNQYKNPALLARNVDADWNSGKDEVQLRTSLP
jgi:fumarate reductase subunit D